jgi:F0F1-type ATP synthase membrane subunit b/b'
LRADARQEAQKDYSQVIGAARAEANAEIKEAVAELNKQQEDARAELQKTSNAIATQIASLTLGRHIAVG